MVETLFSAPHSATEAEYRRLRSYGSQGKSLEQMTREAEAETHDVRWIAIYDLYDLRGDEAGIAHALAQLEDRALVSELTYRDVFTTEALQRMVNKP